MPRMTAAERQRDYYHLRKEGGRCTRCAEPAVAGRILCHTHQQLQRLRDLARAQAKHARQEQA
jgi:hypothetical protein